MTAAAGARWGWGRLARVDDVVVERVLRAVEQVPPGRVVSYGDVAALDWGATHPGFRRRGGQTAVLAARIRFALEQGCETICTMTGEAVPGDPQHSYSNIMKSGFAEAYLRENWIPATD